MPMTTPFDGYVEKPARVSSTCLVSVARNRYSLRSNSRSSSLMRLRSCRVACGLARSSSGAASAVVALARQLASSCGYAPCERHHARLSASFIAAVVTTASSRLAAVQGVYADPNLPSNQADRCALRRQQPRHRSVFECLSVSSQVRPSSPPPRLIYGGDNYAPCCLTKECYPSAGCRFGSFFTSSFQWSKAVGMWSKAAAVGNAGRAAARCPRSQPMRRRRIVHMSIACRARSARPPSAAKFFRGCFTLRPA